MDSERFLELYSNFHGEKVDSLEQICVSNFTGHELLSFIDYVLFAEELKDNKVIGVMGHVDHGKTIVNEVISKIHEKGKEVIIITNNEINPKPPSELMLENEPFIIEKLPELKELFFQKAKHSKKGHERKFKFHG